MKFTQRLKIQLPKMLLSPIAEPVISSEQYADNNQSFYG
jgi:hypothetical protein